MTELPRNFISSPMFPNYIINEPDYTYANQIYVYGQDNLLFLFPARHCQQCFGAEKNVTAVVAVLNAKSEAYYKGDIEKCKSYWIQDSLSSRSIISRLGYSE